MDIVPAIFFISTLSLAIFGISLWTYLFSERNAQGCGKIVFLSADWLLFGMLLCAVLLLGSSLAKLVNGATGMCAFLPTVLTQIALVGLVFLLKRFSTNGFSINFKFGKEQFLLSLKYFGAALLIVMMTGIAINVFMLAAFDELPAQQPIIDMFKSLDGWGARILAVLSIIVFAPIAEELFFRCLLYRALKGANILKVPAADTAFAAITTAIIFAAIHFSAFAVLPLFLMGLVLVAAYEKSGSILVAIVVHSLFNIANIVLISC